MAQACFNLTSAPRRRASTRRRAPIRRRAPVRRARRVTRRTTRRSATTRRRQAPRQLTKYELANINPFDSRVLGVKIPDSNTQPSETMMDDNRFTFSIGALGNAEAKAFLPFIDQAAIAGNPSGGTTWSWFAGYSGATGSSNASNIKNEFVGIRPVGHGVRLSCPLAPLSVTGFVHICIIPVETFGQTTWQFPVSVSQMGNQPWYKRFTLAQLTQGSVTIVNKFLDCTATRYQDSDSGGAGTSTSQEFQFANGWCAILVAVESGPASTNALSAETIVHYEGLTKNGTTNDSTPAAEYDVRQLQDVSRIATRHPGVFTEGQEAELISSTIADLFGTLSNSPGWSMPGGIPGVNQPRLTSY